jgi:hypothetical protein
MLDPITLAAGGALLGIGYLSGRVGRRRSLPRPKKPTKPICGCGHGLEQHDPRTAACHGTVRRPRTESNRYVPCTCRQYTGPRAVEELFATPILPPQD